ncbi:hypothetical protein SAMN06265182_0236 [Persephonella hydrogeniphila]|uniref:Uncharacterized protein n=1 Tax=Persephonella hydrogeniphila TaxID=198703 RepID=A0A285N0M8_9AQUI|nr:hypothetical protein [Persephonella hydrogeniphila]SNZ02888.1 hypothetical protein SAMN06265182_0236 [Persephonella hydrogeniphila]
MKINRYYIAYAVGVIVAVFLLMVYSGMRAADERFSDKILFLERTYTKALKLEEELDKLDREIKRKNIKIVNRKEAEGIILRKADTLIKLYDAQIAETLKEENNSLTISLSFKYYPETPEDIFKLLIDFQKEKSPVLVVKRFELRNTPQGTETSVVLKLIQPFFEGETQ